jgi:two-component system phosphate regulon sensor histidine kinase PhoR
MGQMTNRITQPSPTLVWLRPFRQLDTSIGTKIVLPYLLLTLAVAGVGAFIVVRLTTASLQERFNNQLIDAGRVVSESMVDYELERLEVLRTVAATDGVAESLAAGDPAGLAVRVPQIIANGNTDAVELLDNQGREVYGWQRPPNQPGFSGEERTGADFSQVPEVRRVLDGFVDEFGERRILLSETPYGLMLFTVGPVNQDDQRVGVVLVGTYIQEMVVDLTESAVARVTLYDPQGNVVATTLGGGQKGVTEILQESPEQYANIHSLLRESPDQYPVVVASAEQEVPLNRVQILGQEYTLAYGDWRVRGQSLGLFSVALPSNFIVTTAATSRNLLSLLFSVATICVFALGFVIAQRIIRPLHRLVQTSVAVAQGDLARRTGIQRKDEIGSLAQSFDLMTDHLVERNRQLVEQASKLEAILDSIADGVIVLDGQGLIITANPTAQRILGDVSTDFLADILRELPTISLSGSENQSEIDQALALARLQQPHRYQVGSRVLSAMMAPVKTPNGRELGTVIALRDVTREAEAENLKDGFITTISHELRTPLTAVKGYTDLLLMMADSSADQKQGQFLEAINRNATNLIHHVNKIIDISEIQAGTLRLHKEEICFAELVNEVVENWREQIESKGLSVQVSLSSEGCRIDGDPNRLSWAVDNLLSNAYHYTLTGGRVEIKLGQQNDEVRLDVADTGVGVAVVDQPFLFDRFFRANNNEATFNVAGVGLGLFITRSIIEMHGGRVWAASKLGTGSTFSLALPVLEPEAEGK